MTYEDISIEDAPVLSQGDAIEYLKSLHGEFINQVLTEHGDPYTLDKELEDISGMLAKIIQENWEYIKFIEHPMAPSGISIIKMEEAKK